jgi:hypothetical protein
MPGYDNAYRVTYTFSFTNATLAAAASMRVPTHLGVRQAAIEDINLTPSVAVVNTTGAMVLQIGTTATSGKYAAQNVGTTAGLLVGDSYSVADLDGRVAAYNPQAPNLGTVNKGFIDLLNDGDVAGTLQTKLKVGTVVGTGTPAGTIIANITMRFW